MTVPADTPRAHPSAIEQLRRQQSSKDSMGHDDRHRTVGNDIGYQLGGRRCPGPIRFTYVGPSGDLICPTDVNEGAPGRQRQPRRPVWNGKRYFA